MSLSSVNTIKFFFLSNNLQIRERKQLKLFLLALLKKEGRKANYINYIFCSDDYLLNINRQYLKHDYYTDIITFDLSSAPGAIEAEIYISTDRIRDNALKQKSTLKEETLRVMFHGLLHLSGYKDKSPRDQKKMRAKEDFYISKFSS